MNRGEVLRFPENRDKALRLATRARNLHQFVQDDAPATDRKPCERQQNRLHHRAGADHHIGYAHPPPVQSVTSRSAAAPWPTTGRPISDAAVNRQARIITASVGRYYRCLYPCSQILRIGHERRLKII